MMFCVAEIQVSPFTWSLKDIWSISSSWLYYVCRLLYQRINGLWMSWHSCEVGSCIHGYLISTEQGDLQFTLSLAFEQVFIVCIRESTISGQAIWNLNEQAWRRGFSLDTGNTRTKAVCKAPWHCLGSNVYDCQRTYCLSDLWPFTPGTRSILVLQHIYCLISPLHAQSRKYLNTHISRSNLHRRLIHWMSLWFKSTC